MRFWKKKEPEVKLLHVTMWCSFMVTMTPNGTITFAYRKAYRPSLNAEHVPRIFFDWLGEMEKLIQLDNDGKRCSLINCGVIHS